MIAHLVRRRGLIWLAAIIVVAVGFYLSSVPVVDRYWLARSGSVVVVLGILSSLGQMLHIRMLANTLAMRKRYRAARIRRKYRGDPESVSRLIAEMEARIDAELEEERQRTTFHVGVMEASLVTVGTLIWGFGDLLVLIFETG